MFVIKKVNLDNGIWFCVFPSCSYYNCSFLRVNVIRDLDDRFVSCHNKVNLDSNLDPF